jgi:cellulose synthase/poly-beta-1,6-N-acetylglucosamine synthase-like glycosyltransferase
MAGVLSGFEWVVLGYFLLVNSFLLVLLISAFREMREHRRRVWGEEFWRLLGSEVTPRLSMLAPAHNEAASVAESVRALLTLRYPQLEVVLVNDGSTDGTLAVLEREFDLLPIHPIYHRRLDTKPVRGIYRSPSHPNLVVVDKVNGGKADALNVGLDVATGELVCAIDADTLIEADALLRMVRPFMTGPGVLAAGGTVRVVNGSTVRSGRVLVPRAPRRPLAGIQAVEYLRAFLFGRLGLNRLGGNLIISGAFGLFRREPVIAVGGYLHETVGEDMELVARLRRRAVEEGGPSRVEFVPDPVAWTEVPESLRVLGRQRDRWQRGLADVMRRHRRLIFNPRYGALGMVSFPVFFVIELLGPVIEGLGLVALGVGLGVGALNLPFALLFLLVAYGYALLLNVLSLGLEEISYRRYASLGDRLVLLLWAALENLGYRQLTVFWRLRGMLRFLRGHTDWGVMTRRGFAIPKGSQEQ